MLLYSATDHEVTSVLVRPEVTGRLNGRRSVIQRYWHDHIHFDIAAKVEACVASRGSANAGANLGHQLDERDKVNLLIEQSTSQSVNISPF